MILDILENLAILATVDTLAFPDTQATVDIQVVLDTLAFLAILATVDTQVFLATQE